MCANDHVIIFSLYYRFKLSVTFFSMCFETKISDTILSGLVMYHFNMVTSTATLIRDLTPLVE